MGRSPGILPAWRIVSIPQPVPVPASQAEICKLAGDWLVRDDVMAKVCAMAQLLPFEIAIISGFRTRARQLELAREGRPAADPDVSTHCSCPATGVDLRILGLEPRNYEKALFGEAATRVGLRWGGGSPAPDGIPVDWNHVDDGPRAR